MKKICPYCGRMGEVGAECPGCGYIFQASDRNDAPAPPPVSRQIPPVPASPKPEAPPKQDIPQPRGEKLLFPQNAVLRKIFVIISVLAYISGGLFLLVSLTSFTDDLKTALFGLPFSLIFLIWGFMLYRRGTGKAYGSLPRKLIIVCFILMFVIPNLGAVLP